MANFTVVYDANVLALCSDPGFLVLKRNEKDKKNLDVVRYFIGDTVLVVLGH